MAASDVITISLGEIGSGEVSAVTSENKWVVLKKDGAKVCQVQVSIKLESGQIVEEKKSAPAAKPKTEDDVIVDLRKQIRAARKETTETDEIKQAKQKLDELTTKQINELTSKFVADSTSKEDRKKVIGTLLKKLKEVSRKEYRFAFALEKLEELMTVAEKNDMKVEQKKIENVKVEVKMDEHDYVSPVSTNLNDNIEGGAPSLGTIVLFVAFVAVAAGAYMKYKK